jgi:hypothetical protein
MDLMLFGLCSHLTIIVFLFSSVRLRIFFGISSVFLRIGFGKYRRNTEEQPENEQRTSEAGTNQTITRYEQEDSRQKDQWLRHQYCMSLHPAHKSLKKLFLKFCWG